MRQAPIAVLLILAGCGSGDDPVDVANAAANTALPAIAEAANETAEDPTRWDLQSSGEGVGLALFPAGSGATAIRLFCPAAMNRLVVNVPAFGEIGSEERMSFGSGGEVVVLVANPHGDKQRGGVTGMGPVPANLPALVGGPLSASYGAQTSGPHEPPPADVAAAFLAACRQSSSASTQPPVAPPPPPSQAGACLMQGADKIDMKPLKAVGTEPFWGARIDGRCVTYNHPEDQQGTRIWTRYAKIGAGQSWTGTHGGKPFVLKIRPQKDCSDGMSDRVYPLAVDLTVNGEERKGCAAPV